MKNDELYQLALETIASQILKKYGKAGHVACALETAKGNIYTGICIDVPCSIGLCAEQSAIAEMLKHRETKIKKLLLFLRMEQLLHLVEDVGNSSRKLIKRI